MREDLEELQAQYPSRFKLWFTLDHAPAGTLPCWISQHQGPWWVLVSLEPAFLTLLGSHVCVPGRSGLPALSFSFLFTGRGQERLCC